jgi:plasmid stability protein
MRIPLTLDDDIAARLETLARHHPHSLEFVIPETLKAGLACAEESMTAPAFRVEPVSLGAPRANGESHCVSAWLEAIEGPMHQ